MYMAIYAHAQNILVVGDTISILDFDDKGTDLLLRKFNHSYLPCTSVVSAG